MKTFLDFLTEGQSKYKQSGWYNVHTGKIHHGNFGHATIIGQHWKDFGYTEEEIEHMKRIYHRASAESAVSAAMDGTYGRFYAEGWVRWHHMRVPNQNVIEVSSSEDNIRESKDFVLDLCADREAEHIMLSDKYGDNFDVGFVITFLCKELEKGKWF